ncbi:MAG: rhamnogalacturonan lyase [Oscillospiraceae bacterium]|nr:rhamnogalacturonan lyase [Oscillospiraceae bacterium]
MKNATKRCIAMAAVLAVSGTGISAATPSAVVTAASAPMVEYLNRGISAVNTGSGMLVNWRFLASDPDDAVFKLYRDNNLIYTSTEKANGASCFLDAGGSANSVYKVETYNDAKLISSETCNIQSSNSYFDVKLDKPANGSDGGSYSPNDMSVGDVDGDGQYELFVKWDPSTSKDNSQKGKTDKVYIDCYRLDGAKLWRIDLGVNIRAGAHYTQFYVADFDLDGKCEMTCKTSDGTVDGTGKVIGDASKVYRDSSGLIYSGNEFYTLFDGATGAALDTVNYEPGRGDPTKWGKSSDKYNRVERYWGSVAYLDGVHPSVITGRGYYGRLTATAYAVENKKLKKLWTFDTGTSSSTPGYGDGNHNSMVADVDGDGKQEIITGSTCIDDNGKLKWNTNTGHGDALHVGDLDPSNPGIEVWTCHEDSPYGVSLIDADTGKTIFRHNGSGDTGRCCADNVWAGNPGAELWGNGNEVNDVKGNTLNCRRPAINFLSYWDGDLEREILDGYTDSPATISKMTGDAGKTTITTLLSTDGYYTCNTTKGTPCLSADIFGDWREELIVRKADGTGIRIYATTYDTDYRIQCLMHDTQYRMQVSSQNTAYNQPPHTSFYLGSDQPLPARPIAEVNGGESIPPEPVTYDPISGSLMTAEILDTVYYNSWGFDDAAAVGDAVFGDRGTDRCAISALPDKLAGAEIILTPCDAKASSVNQAVLTALKDVTLYVGVDSRVENAPAWLADWNQTNQTIQTSNDVTFNLYTKTLNAGDTVTLGANGQSTGCMNYIVLAAADRDALIGDVNLDGTVTAADAVELLKFLLTEKELTAEQAAQADINGDRKLNAVDLTLLKRMLMQ